MLVFGSLVFVSPKLATAASLSFSTTQNSIQPQLPLLVTLRLDPEANPIIGTDIFLTYNPAKVNLTKIESTNAFNSIHAVSINNAQGNAKFALSNPVGTFEFEPVDIATITLVPLTSGSINLSFLASPGNTKDTNVVINGGQDVLTSTSPLTLTVTEATENSATIPSPSPTTKPTLTPTPLPTAISTNLPPIPQTLQKEFTSPLPSSIQPLNHPNNPQILGTTNKQSNQTLQPAINQILPSINGADSQYTTYVIYLLIATNIVMATQLLRRKQAN